MAVQDPPSDAVAQLAELLWNADNDRKPIEPLRHAAERLGVATSQENAYAVQRQVRARRVAGGDRVVGRKIGLTAVSVQKQIGVDQPDYGALWSSTAFGDGATVDLKTLIHPKLEAEVAIVIDCDLDDAGLSLADLISATAFALPALEIVDSRVAHWDIRLFDTISDNASAAGFVIGADPKRLDRVSLRDARMVMTENGATVSEGRGSDCLGHPLNAALWLARMSARSGDPLRKGDIVLTGALGPMVAIKAGATYEAEIEGLGKVAATFA